MSFGWLRPLGLSQPGDILDEAINQHKVICAILMTIIACQNLQNLLILFNNLWLDEVPVRGLAAILFSRQPGVRGRASWELFLGLIFFSSSFFWVFMGSMYRAYIVNYKQDLILENLHSFIYFYLIFLPECFVTIATGTAQNPCIKALRRIPAWASFYLA